MAAVQKEVAKDETKPEDKKETGAAVPKSKERKVKVNCAMLNVREKPSMKNDVVFVVKKDDVLTVSQKRNGWYHITGRNGENEVEGWIDSNFVE